MKYYAVYKGKSVIPKIYTSWDECKKEVIGFKGAIYKSFTTEKEAKEFISLNSQGRKLENIQDEESESGLFIYVDGSFTVDKGNFSYGLVAVNDGKIIYEDNNMVIVEKWPGILVHADKNSGEPTLTDYVLSYLKGKGDYVPENYKEVTIAYDYQGIESWALGTWKRNNKITSEYNEYMQNKMKEINIIFKKIKGHSGHKYNDLADKLAKEALGIK